MQDVRILERRNNPVRGEGSGQYTQGGAIPQQDVNHYLTIRIDSLKDAQKYNEEHNVRAFKAPTEKQASEEEALSLDETLASLQRLIEGGVPSGKLIERSEALLEGVSKLAAELSAPDLEVLAQGISDAADETEAQYNSLSEEESISKVGQIKEVTAKLLRDALSVLRAGEPGVGPGREARVIAKRREIAQRPGTETKKVREQKRADLAATQAIRDSEVRAAQAEVDAQQGVVDALLAAPVPRRGRAAAAAQAIRDAEATLRAKQEALARLFVPEGRPARGTAPYRALVERAYAEPYVGALREVARAYHVNLGTARSKDVIRRLLLA